MFRKSVSILALFALLSVLTCSAYPLQAQGQQAADQAGVQSQPGAIEKMGSPDAPRVSSFPWLWVVAGVVVVGVLVYFLFIAKPDYTLTVTKTDGVDGTPAAGAVKYSKGTIVNYAYTAQPGYAIKVTLDGAVVNNSGSITMDKDHALAATSSYDIRGAWNLTFSWGGANPGHTVINFSGTPTSGHFAEADYGPEIAGTYTVNGATVTWIWSNSIHTTYTGTLSNTSTMAGTMTRDVGTPGTWSATKLGQTSADFPNTSAGINGAGENKK
jgi:hypothetical protein